MRFWACVVVVCLGVAGTPRFLLKTEGTVGVLVLGHECVPTIGWVVASVPDKLL